ncbi:hypothetical protein EGR_01180 [Echinococcus granulosus]|uniref:BZIP domain-containing protein n=2 Tax=Echinococcus granulosus TaxID=6210 RepID=W6UZS6_ECHGR|nr:hypothetical protein EGR_01180 [Echinococcus granulosus]EUB64052.1 hypothetical protein EGR_01180 [Echinococcus granulosus]
MAQEYPTDEELVQMTTMQLRSLLEQHAISQEQHRELRTRRRRLQNRKYARRCAKKKQTEVAELAAAAKKESSAIRSLRQQLSRLNTSVDRLDRQIDSLAKLRISMTETPFSLRMVALDGTELGLAHFNSHHLPLLSYKGDESVSSTSASHLIPRMCFKTKPSMQRNFCLTKSATTTASTMRVPVPPAGGACGSPAEGQEVVRGATYSWQDVDIRARRYVYSGGQAILFCRV